MLQDKSQEQADPSLSPDTLHRFEGLQTTEIQLRCRPEETSLGSPARQTESVYRNLEEALALEGAALEHVVQETVFFRSVRVDRDGFQEGRGRALRGHNGPKGYAPACTFIEQPPLEGVPLHDPVLGDSQGPADVELLVRAVIPHRHVSSVTWWTRGDTTCRCGICSGLGARVHLLGGQKHVFAGNVFGTPGSTFDEALSMFEVAGRLLEREGMDFRSVARTWIYLRDMDRDYAEFNRARNTYFRDHGVTVLPASTGINGSPLPDEHNFLLGLYALEGPSPISREIMTTPTLNEAPEYGSAFSRGMRVVDAGKTALYISGTASVDEEGRTVHVEDFQAQVERTLLNVSKLLENQNAGFQDMASAITYIKRASDAPLFQKTLAERGIDGFPHVVVEAGVCRPDLLIEMEGLALLPRPPDCTLPGAAGA